MATKKVTGKVGPASKTKPVKKVDFLYEDGLTEIERKQRISQPNFLTGSAKSQIDESSIRPELADVGSTYSFSQSTTLALLSVSTVLILAIIKGGGGF